MALSGVTGSRWDLGFKDMSVILSLLGIVLAAAGVAAIGFGIPINEFTLGTTLVLAGTTGLAGGLVLIGLAAVVAELGRITEALKTRVRSPDPRPVRPRPSNRWRLRLRRSLPSPPPRSPPVSALPRQTFHLRQTCRRA